LVVRKKVSLLTTNKQKSWVKNFFLCVCAEEMVFGLLQVLSII
jgi:hypothetical protein